MELLDYLFFIADGQLFKQTEPILSAHSFANS